MKVVFRANSVAEAYLVRDLLRDHGLDAEVANEAISQGWGSVPLGPSSVPSVWIPEEDRTEEAKALIRGIKREDAGETWTCAACAEKSPGSFGACWSCGADRKET